jgi:hypothetical protein
MVTVNDLLYLLVFISSILYITKINRPLYYYIFSSILLVVFVLSKHIKISFCLAGILTATIYVFLDKQIPLRLKKSNIKEILNNHEHFKSGSRIKSKASTSKDSKKEEKIEKEEFVDDNSSVSSVDSTKEDFEPPNNTLDTKQSYMNVIEKLSPMDTQNLNETTKELISTQKQLMETLQSMGPALKEGKTILDTFKNYFNDSNLTDTLKI